MAEGAEQTVESPTTQKPERTIDQSRFNQIYWKAKEAERRNVALEQRLAELESSKAMPEVSTAPSLEQFDYDEDKYRQARETFLINQAKKEAVEAVRAERERERQMTAEMTKKQKTDEFLKRSGEYALTNPEYDEVTKRAGAAGVSINQTATEIIINDPNGPALHHYLLANPMVLEEINAIQDPGMVGVKIGQLMTSMKSVPSTSAPEPIEPGEGGATSNRGINALYDDNLSPEEFERIVRANGG
jgi:hypothetical protein